MSHRPVSQRGPLVEGVSRASAGQMHAGKTQESGRPRWRPCQLHLLEQQNHLQDHQNRKQNQLHQPHTAHQPKPSLSHYQQHLHSSHQMPQNPHASTPGSRTTPQQHRRHPDASSRTRREAPDFSWRQGEGHNQQRERASQLRGSVHLQGERNNQQGEKDNQQGVRTKYLPEKILHLGLGSSEQAERSNQQGEKASQQGERILHVEETADHLREMIHQLSDETSQQVQENQLRKNVRQSTEPASQQGDMVYQLGQTASQNLESVYDHHRQDWRVYPSEDQSPEDFPYTPAEGLPTPPDHPRVLEPTGPLLTLIDQGIMEQSQSEHTMWEQSQSEQTMWEQSQSEHSEMERGQSQYAVRMLRQSEYSEAIEYQLQLSQGNESQSKQQKDQSQSEHCERSQSELESDHSLSEHCEGSQSDLERDQSQLEHCERHQSELESDQSQSEDNERSQSEFEVDQSQWEGREDLGEVQMRTQSEKQDGPEGKDGEDQECITDTQQQWERSLRVGQRPEKEFMMDVISDERDRATVQPQVAQPLIQFTEDMSQSPSHPASRSFHWQRDGLWAETSLLHLTEAQAMQGPPLATQSSLIEDFLQAPSPCKPHPPENSQPGSRSSWPDFYHQTTLTPLVTHPYQGTVKNLASRSQALPFQQTTPICTTLSHENTPTDATPSHQTTPTNGTPSQQVIPTHATPFHQTTPSQVTPTHMTPLLQATPLWQESVGSRLHHYEQSDSESDRETGQWEETSSIREEEPQDPQLALMGLIDSVSSNQNALMQSLIFDDTAGVGPVTPSKNAEMDAVLSSQNVGVKSLPSDHSLEVESVVPDQRVEMEYVLSNQSVGVESGPSSGDVVSQAIKDIREAIEEVKQTAVRSPYTLDLLSEPVWVMRPPSPETDKSPPYPYILQSDSNVLYHSQPTTQTENQQLYHFTSQSENNLLYHFQPTNQSENRQLYHCQPTIQTENKQLYHCTPQSENNLLFHSQPTSQSENKQLYHCTPQSENNLLYHCQPTTQSQTKHIFHCQPTTEQAQSEHKQLYHYQPSTQSENNLLYQCTPQSEDNLLYHHQPTTQSENKQLYQCQSTTQSDNSQLRRGKRTTQSDKKQLYPNQPTIQSNASPLCHRPPLAETRPLLQSTQREHPIPEAFASLGKEILKPLQLCDLTDSSEVPYEEPPKSLAFPTFVDVPGPCDPVDLLDGVLFAALYLGCTHLMSERNPSKNARMQQAQEAMNRIRNAQGRSRNKALDGAPAGMTEVDLFLSTQRIKVLNTETQESMLDQPLRTISYIADIGNIVVLMARRKMIRSRSAQDQLDSAHHTNTAHDSKKQYRMVCHVFQSEDAQLIAQAIGQAFTVAYQEFLRANGIDPEDLSQREYSELLNTQDMYNDDLIHFSKTENCRDVYIEKQKGEILGVVIVESGWGSILPTVIIASLMHSGPAARSGRLNIGDQIMTVNGTSLVGLPLNTCQSIIKGLKSQSRIKINIVRCPPVTMVLIRRPDLRYQLGFSVQNGIICSLMRGGIAERGGVRVGHRIIDINAQSVVATPHEKIVHILSNAVGEIHMKTMPAAMYRLLTAQEQPIYI